MSDLTKAVKALKDNSWCYQKPEDYYDGKHKLSFATEKFKNAFGELFRAFALNVCPAVVDAVADKLVVENFGVDEGDAKSAEDAWSIWQANRMGQRSGQVHKEVLRAGDAYVIVWPDVTSGKATIYPNRAATCTVFYDEETPGKILWAAKYWTHLDGRVRLNLYYANQIEKYIAKKAALDDLYTQKKEQTIENRNRYSVLPEAKEFLPYTEDGPETIKNPYGVVPVFHFANNADVGSFGMSELKHVVPVQDALNKSVLDMLVAMEFASYRQRWASGIEIEIDETTGKPIPPFTAGVERLWVTESPEAKFGDFEATDLEQFLKVKDGMRIDIATVSGTPLHYFLLTGAAFPQSGISIEKLESRFLNKVRDRMEAFGNVWEDVMRFALRIENKGKDAQLHTNWANPAPLSQGEQLDNLLKKEQMGVSEEQLWKEAGYGEKDIKTMQEANAAKAEEEAKRFNAGDLGNNLP